MGAYIIDNYILDFIERSEENLAVIQEINNRKLLKNQDFEVHEINQLINSMLARVVFPYEFISNNFNKDRIDKFFCDGEIKRQYKNNKEYKEAFNYVDEFLKKKTITTDTSKGELYNSYDKLDVCTFIKRLRDAISHSGNGKLFFYPFIQSVTVNKKINSKIEAVIFADEYEDTKSGKLHEFFIIIAVEELKKLLDCISTIFRFFIANESGKFAEKTELFFEEIKNKINYKSEEIRLKKA